MYAAPLTEVVRLERKRCYYDANHQALKQLLAEKKQRFSKVYFLDLHSYGMDTLVLRWLSFHKYNWSYKHLRFSEMADGSGQSHIEILD